MNKDIQLFNAIQLCIVCLYLYINYQTIHNFPYILINVYILAITEYIVLLLFFSIEINKLISLVLGLLTVSIMATSYYIYSYVNILHDCSDELPKRYNIFLLYMLATLIINNGLLFVYFCVGLNLQNYHIFPDPIINEYTPIVSIT